MSSDLAGEKLCHRKTENTGSSTKIFLPTWPRSFMTSSTPAKHFLQDIAIMHFRKSASGSSRASPHHHQAAFWTCRHFPCCGWNAICHRGVVGGEFLGKRKNFWIVVNEAGAWAGSAGDGGRRRQQQRGAATEHSAADLLCPLLQDVLLHPVAPRDDRDENSSWAHPSVFPGEASCLHKHSVPSAALSDFMLCRDPWHIKLERSFVSNSSWHFYTRGVSQGDFSLDFNTPISQELKSSLLCHCVLTVAIDRFRLRF